MAASMKYEGLDSEEKARLNAVASELVEEKSMTMAQRIKEGTKISERSRKSIPKLKYATNNNDIFRSHYSFVCLTCSLFAQ